MKKCSYCAEAIQDDAVICRFCNRDLRTSSTPNPQSPPPAKKGPTTISTGCGCVIILIVVGLILLLVNLLKEESSGFGSSRPLSDLALDAGYSAVRKELKTPSTASLVQSKVLAQNGRRFLVYVEVDAENEFGATIRTAFVAAVEVMPTSGQYSYNSYGGVTELPFRTIPSKYQLDEIKRLNGWPNTSTPANSETESTKPPRSPEPPPPETPGVTPARPGASETQPKPAVDPEVEQARRRELMRDLGTEKGTTWARSLTQLGAESLKRMDPIARDDYLNAMYGREVKEDKVLPTFRALHKEAWKEGVKAILGVKD